MIKSTYEIVKTHRKTITSHNHSILIEHCESDNDIRIAYHLMNQDSIGKPISIHVKNKMLPELIISLTEINKVIEDNGHYNPR